MDSFSFYKDLYQRELNRRKDLDSGANLPLTLISIVITINSFLLKEVLRYQSEDIVTYIHYAVFVIFLISVVTASIFLSKSYNNFFKGFAYVNLAKTSEIRQYELKLDNYNRTVKEDERISFENSIIERLVSITDHNIHFNDERGKNLYRCKASLIFSIFITAINFIFFALNYIRL